VLRNGQTVPFILRTVKGVDYGVISAVAGDYEARYTAPAAGAASLSPAVLGFGPVAMGAEVQPRTVTLTNTGTRPLKVSSVTVTGTNPGAFLPLVSDSCTGATMAVGGTCTVQVRFAAGSTGRKTANLTFTHNGRGDTSIPLGGIGLPAGGVASYSTSA